jgi:hypothetical protein
MTPGRSPSPVPRRGLSSHRRGPPAGATITAPLRRGSRSHARLRRRPGSHVVNDTVAVAGRAAAGRSCSTRGAAAQSVRRRRNHLTAHDRWCRSVARIPSRATGERVGAVAHRHPRSLSTSGAPTRG